MRLEPWLSSLSCQRYNQKSIFRLLTNPLSNEVIVLRQVRVF
jgi:hypothetical protein